MRYHPPFGMKYVEFGSLGIYCVNINYSAEGIAFVKHELDKIEDLPTDLHLIKKSNGKTNVFLTTTCEDTYNLVEQALMDAKIARYRAVVRNYEKTGNAVDPRWITLETENEEQ